MSQALCIILKIANFSLPQCCPASGRFCSTSLGVFSVLSGESLSRPDLQQKERKEEKRRPWPGLMRRQGQGEEGSSTHHFLGEHLSLAHSTPLSLSGVEFMNFPICRNLIIHFRKMRKCM